MQDFSKQYNIFFTVMLYKYIIVDITYCDSSFIIFIRVFHITYIMH